MSVLIVCNVKQKWQHVLWNSEEGRQSGRGLGQATVLIFSETGLRISPEASKDFRSLSCETESCWISVMLFRANSVSLHIRSLFVARYQQNKRLDLI